jgi:transcriptional regulator with XRE-family HTH domain
MGPFGETVLAWRLERGLTQAQLARAAGMPRSNLSAVERGDREVTLKTLRALAVALDVRPGVLADGLAPGSDALPLTRAGLERVASAAAHGTALSDPHQGSLARNLGEVSAHLASGQRKRHRSGRRADRAYLLLRGRTSSDTLASLVDRVRGQPRRG